MKKSLVVMVIACAAALPPAAQAQIANVRLYGSLNLDFELVSGKQADGTNPTVNRVSSNSSVVVCCNGGRADGKIDSTTVPRAAAMIGR